MGNERAARRRFANNEGEYERVPYTYDTADGMDPEQFYEPQRKFPLKPVIFVFCFMVAGTTCIVIGTLISLGLLDEKYSDRIWPIFILGTIMFIPGGYYSFVFICIIFGKLGYTPDDIPTF